MQNPTYNFRCREAHQACYWFQVQCQICQTTHRIGISQHWTSFSPPSSKLSPQHYQLVWNGTQGYCTKISEIRLMAECQEKYLSSRSLSTQIPCLRAVWNFTFEFGCQMQNLLSNSESGSHVILVIWLWLWNWSEFGFRFGFWIWKLNLNLDLNLKAEFLKPHSKIWILELVSIQVWVWV